MSTAPAPRRDVSAVAVLWALALLAGAVVGVYVVHVLGL